MKKQVINVLKKEEIDMKLEEFIKDLSPELQASSSF